MVNWHPLGTIWHPLEGPGMCGFIWSWRSSQKCVFFCSKYGVVGWLLLFFSSRRWNRIVFRWSNDATRSPPWGVSDRCHLEFYGITLKVHHVRRMRGIKVHVLFSWRERRSKCWVDFLWSFFFFASRNSFDVLLSLKVQLQYVFVELWIWTPFLAILLVTFLGWWKRDLYKWLSDLQLGDEKVTLNHLVKTCSKNICHLTMKTIHPVFLQMIHLKKSPPEGNLDDRITAKNVKQNDRSEVVSPKKVAKRLRGWRRF